MTQSPNRKDESWSLLKPLQASVLVFGPLKARRLAVSSEKGTGFIYDDLFLDYLLEQGPC